MTVIRFDSVTCDYEGRRALGPVTVELSERRIGIIGPNGGGKSTFVRLINGLADASSGRIDVGGLAAAALGSDFDGIDCDLEMKDYSGFPVLLEKMQKHFTDDQIDLITHKNFLRIL